MSETASAARGGEFATSRRGGVSEDCDFIRRKAFEGVPVSAIARMVARPVSDVRAIACTVAAPIERPAPKVTKRPRVVLSLWRGLMAVPDAPTGRKTMAQVAAPVCAEHGVSLEDVIGPMRFRVITRARQAVMYALVQEKRWSLPQIGKFLGDRDHTTVLHGYRAHAKRIAEEA